MPTRKNHPDYAASVINGAQMFEDCPIPFAVTRLSDGAYLSVNKAAESMLGRSRADLQRQTSVELGFWKDVAERQAFVEQLQQHGVAQNVRITIIDKHGLPHLCNLSATLLPLNGERYVFSCLVSLCAQMLAEEDARFHLMRFLQLFENMRDGCALIGPDGRFAKVNHAFCEMTGYSSEELLTMGPRDVTPAKWHDLDAASEAHLAFAHHSSELYEKEQVHKDGTVYPVELQLYPNLDAQGQSDGFWGVVRDISERKAQQSNLNFLAYHDPLTQLPNRALLMDRLEQTLKRAKRTILSPIRPSETKSRQLQLALLFLDVDRFKNVNDTLGHQVGDALLQIVASNISRGLREVDVLARFGGDEFVILLDSPLTIEHTTAVARRILSVFAEPIRLQEKDVYVTTSIGISLFPRDGLDVDTLIKHADLAMFKAKDEGRNTFCFYEASMGSAIQDRMQMENALRGALQRQEFLLHYQPQIDLATGKLAGVEALLRWQHPNRGFVPPLFFIPIAEEIGLIREIGAWVMKEACRQMAVWRDAGFTVPRMAVNLSVQQLDDPGLVDYVARQLEENGLTPAMLELEVTESLLMHRTELAMSMLHGLEALGIQLAIDDFGTGYSSLTYLKSLPVHRLKIDYSFVRDIGRDSNDEAIIRAIIALAASLDLETVAEGVEREEQEQFLYSEGCHISQGFRYARPLAPEQLYALFGNNPVALAPPKPA